MLMTNFLKNRRSVREFKNKKVDVKVLEKIDEYLKELENQEGSRSILFNIYKNGEDIYRSLKGIGGYSGVMIESPHYIGMELVNNEERVAIYSSYYMEKLITKLNDLGIATCWISLMDVDGNKKKNILGSTIGQTNYLLAIGYPKPKNPFINEAFSERLGIEEIVFNEEIEKPIDVEELEAMGLSDLFYYVRFAPSAYNKQPWRFLVERDKVTLLLAYSKEEDLNLADAGIIMYYFEALASSIGINSKWELINGVHKTKECYYKYIGEFNL
jgi:nitroreductase